MLWTRRRWTPDLKYEYAIFCMALGFFCLRTGSDGVGFDAVAAPNDYHRLGQVKPPTGLCSDGMAGLQGLPAAFGNLAARVAGVWRTDRNHAILYPQPLGRVA